MTDVLPTAPVQKAERAPNPMVRIATGFLLPLFFVIVFPLAFVSALHHPTPHDLPLLIVGPDQVVAEIATNLDATDEFAATRTDVVSEARSSVEQRSVDGAVEVTTVPTADAQAAPTFTVTTYVANAGGRSVAGAVEAAASTIATQLGTTSTVVDVAPLTADDTLGTGLFYILVYTSLGAYLVIIVLTQVMPGAPLRLRYMAVGIASIVAPLIVFGLSSIFVGDYGASYGSIAGLLGVNALYVFTVGAAAILIEQFLGKAATFGIMGLIVFLNFPSAGGAAPAALLPGFWQGVHNVYFGAGAFESFRSIVYFDGNGLGRWFFQLLAWTIGLMLLTFIVHLMKTVRKQGTRLATLSRNAEHHEPEHIGDEAEHPSDERRRHPKVEAYRIDQQQPQYVSTTADPATTGLATIDENDRRAIDASEGALR